MADELDGFFIEEDFSGDDACFSGDDFIFVDEGTTLDELCSPGLPDGIFIPGCIFSDSIEEEINFDDEEVIFFIDDNDFDFNDDNDDFDDDFDGFDFNDNSRSGNFVG